MSPPKYSRDALEAARLKLAHLQNRLEDVNSRGWEAGGDDYSEELEALDLVADFLAETIAVLDKQRKARQRRAASEAIAQKRNRGRRSR